MKSFVCIVLHHFFYTKICLFILGAQIKEPQRFETLTFQPPPNQQQTNRTDIKSKMDEQLKSQHQAVGRSVLSHSPTTNSLTQVIKKRFVYIFRNLLFTFLSISATTNDPSYNYTSNSKSRWIGIYFTHYHEHKTTNGPTKSTTTATAG